jgi:hypothetical protein
VSPLFTALQALASTHEETHRARDQAREDLAQYLKSLAANRTEQAQEIVQKYRLSGFDPVTVAVAIEAASYGRDALAAAEEHEESED